MIDLCLWRARIGRFHPTRRGLLHSKVSDHETVHNEVTLCDIFITYASCYLLLSVVFCAASTFKIIITSNSIAFSVGERNIGGTISWIENSGRHDSQCHPALHVPVLVSLCITNIAGSVLRLLLSNDIQTNPGPDTQSKNEKQKPTATADTETNESCIAPDMASEILKAIHEQRQQSREQVDEIRNGFSAIKTELEEIKQKCEIINQRCDRLEEDNSRLTATVANIVSDTSELFSDAQERKEEMTELSKHIETLKEEIVCMNTEIDRLEGFSRRDNLRIFGIAQQSDNEDYDTCARAVVDVLNSVQGPKTWEDKDIVRAHRTGTALNNHPKPMIVKFAQWKDKMSLLKDRDFRDKLETKGVRVSNDLTYRQMNIVRQAKREGKTAYFIKGKMTVVPRKQDVRADNTTKTASATNDATHAVDPVSGQKESADKDTGQSCLNRNSVSCGGDSPTSHVGADDSGLLPITSQCDKIQGRQTPNRSPGVRSGNQLRSARGTRDVSGKGGQQTALHGYLTSRDRSLRSSNRPTSK